MNFVTVVFEKEVTLLRTQARSIDLYVSTDYLNEILIVTNDNHVTYDIDPNWWGKNRDRVKILSHSDLGINSSIGAWYENRDGWNRQQIAKLKGAQHLNGKSIALDAKTWFCSPIDLHRLLDKTRRYINGEDITIPDVFLPGSRMISRFFSSPFSGKMRCPSGVPFIFDRETIDRMEQFIISNAGQSLVDFFGHVDYQHGVTEFTMYSAFQDLLISRGDLVPPEVDHSKKMCTFSNLARNFSKHDAEYFFSSFEDDRLTTVSIHRDALPALSTEQKEKWMSFLQERKLINN